MNMKKVWGGLSLPSRSLLVTLDRDGQMPPSNLRANYSFGREELGGPPDMPEELREVLNIDLAMRETEAQGLTETAYPDAGQVKMVRLTDDGRALMSALEG